MINKIKTLEELPTVIKKLHDNHETIVLAGGVFDVLHPGHVSFFKEAKKKGSVLILLLESDESVKEYKGVGRPIFRQSDRSQMLSAFTDVDFVIPLKGILSDNDYFKLTSQIKPAIIAATKGDAAESKKREQARANQAEYEEIVDLIGNHSSSDIIKKLGL